MIAVGQVYTSEYDDSNGVRRSSLEMRATSVGPDLSQSLVRILDKVKDADPAPASENDAESSDETAADADDDGVTVAGKALPLSA